MGKSRGAGARKPLTTGCSCCSSGCRVWRWGCFTRNISLFACKESPVSCMLPSLSPLPCPGRTRTPAARSGPRRASARRTPSSWRIAAASPARQVHQWWQAGCGRLGRLGAVGSLSQGPLLPPFCGKAFAAGAKPARVVRAWLETVDAAPVCRSATRARRGRRRRTSKAGAGRRGPTVHSSRGRRRRPPLMMMAQMSLRLRS